MGIRPANRKLMPRLPQGQPSYATTWAMSSVSSKWPGKASWQNTADLNNTIFSGRDRLERQRISDDHIAKGRCMFVAGGAIGDR